MRALGYVAIVVAALTAMGCKDSRPSSIPSSAAASASTALQRPEDISVSGVYVHTPSGMTFPTQVGEFRRAQVFRYDTGGLDVSGQYNFVPSSGGIAATVYVYPAPRVLAAQESAACSQSYQFPKYEVLRSHVDARVTREDSASAPSGVSRTGQHAMFEYMEIFRGTRQEIQSELYVYCFVGGPWLLKYRFSYPKGFPDAEKRIADFMAQLPITVGARS